MSVMGPDGKILQPGGGWWSPYGDTDEEIHENMKTGKMPNAPDAMRVGPRTVTGSKRKDRALFDMNDCGKTCPRVPGSLSLSLSLYIYIDIGPNYREN